MHNSQDFQILSMLIDPVGLIINRIEKIREKFNSRERKKAASWILKDMRRKRWTVKIARSTKNRSL